MALYDHMTYLGAGGRAAFIEFAVDYDAAADARAERDEDGIFKVFTGAETRFAERCGVCVVCHLYRHAEALCKLIAEREISQSEISGEFDHPPRTFDHAGAGNR